MSKQFTDTTRSLVEHGLIRKGLMKPSRVWHIDPITKQRTLVEDNTEYYRQLQAQNAASTLHAASSGHLTEQETTV